MRRFVLRGPGNITEDINFRTVGADVSDYFNDSLLKLDLIQRGSQLMTAFHSIK